MAKIYKRLSGRVQADGKSEVLLSLKDGHSYFLRAKSGIFVTPDNFRNGEVVVNRRKVGNDIEYHKIQETRIRQLETHIYDLLNTMKKEQITTEWFKSVVDKFNHPEEKEEKETKEEKTPKPTFHELIDLYLQKKEFAYHHTNHMRVVERAIYRYEGFIQATDDKRKGWKFDVDKVSREDIEDFFDYYRNEKSLSEEYPTIFKKLLVNYPVGLKKGHTKIIDRGGNTMVKFEKRLKAFFNWLNESGKTDNKPFGGIKIGSEQHGEPIYITIAERNTIADHYFVNKHLKTQRDIFIFHCFVGCRVGDLMRLTRDNIVNGMLIYAPHKTKDDGETTTVAKVPLHPKAIELIAKYKGKDTKGRLFPFISPQKYNDAIKEIFKACEITRNVVWRNPTTGEDETRPINEIASSHMARRTFVGNAYQKVSDPNIIGKMSGHVEGSKAFSRYRNIEDETLRNVIDLIG